MYCVLQGTFAQQYFTPELFRGAEPGPPPPNMQGKGLTITVRALSALSKSLASWPGGSESKCPSSLAGASRTRCGADGVWTCFAPQLSLCLCGNEK